MLADKRVHEQECILKNLLRINYYEVIKVFLKEVELRKGWLLRRKSEVNLYDRIKIHLFQQK